MVRAHLLVVVMVMHLLLLLLVARLLVLDHGSRSQECTRRLLSSRRLAAQDPLAWEQTVLRAVTCAFDAVVWVDRIAAAMAAVDVLASSALDAVAAVAAALAEGWVATCLAAVPDQSVAVVAVVAAVRVSARPLDRPCSSH